MDVAAKSSLNPLVLPVVRDWASNTLISVKKRISLSDSNKDEVHYKERVICIFIRTFLAISSLGLIVEFVTYFR